MLPEICKSTEQQASAFTCPETWPANPILNLSQGERKLPRIERKPPVTGKERRELSHMGPILSWQTLGSNLGRSGERRALYHHTTRNSSRSSLRCSVYHYTTRLGLNSGRSGKRRVVYHHTTRLGSNSSRSSERRSVYHHTTRLGSNSGRSGERRAVCQKPAAPANGSFLQNGNKNAQKEQKPCICT